MRFFVFLAAALSAAVASGEHGQNQQQHHQGGNEDHDAAVRSVLPARTKNVLALGSCNNQRKDANKMWETIYRMQPDAWVWLGDNIYPNEDIADPTASEKDKRMQYEIQAAKPGYARLASSTKVIGTWDDHDYGGNDESRTYPYKESSKALVLDFLKEPKDSPRRKMEGIYASYTFFKAPNIVKVIVLDMRYFMEKNGAELLGEAQWKWLEQEITSPQQSVNVLVSSIQVINDQSFLAERWGDWPLEQARLYALLNRTNIAPTIIFSGDRHYGEVASECSTHGHHGGLVEVTTSGMTQVRPAKFTIFECNPFRTSDMVNDPNFASLEFDWEAGRAQASIRNENGVALASAFIELKGPPRPCVSGNRGPKFCGIGMLGMLVFAIAAALVLLVAGVVIVWHAGGVSGSGGNIGGGRRRRREYDSVQGDDESGVNMMINSGSVISSNGSSNGGIIINEADSGGGGGGGIAGGGGASGGGMGVGVGGVGGGIIAGARGFLTRGGAQRKNATYKRLCETEDFVDDEDL